MANCKCSVAPVIRFINSGVFDNKNTIFLDQFESVLKCDGALDKVNSCLSDHGFIGSVQQLDGLYVYSNEDVVMEILIDSNVNLPSKFVETENGEWSHTMNSIKKVKSLDGIKFKVGDIIYVAYEGTYSRYTYRK